MPVRRYVLLLLSWLSACGSDDKDASSKLPDAGDIEAVDAATMNTDGSPGERPTIERGRTLSRATRDLDALGTSNGVLHLFVKQDPTLSTSASACENAKAVAARVKDATGSTGANPCATVTTTCGDKSASVEAAFAACTLEGTSDTVSGSIKATVSTKTDASVTTVSVSLALSNVQISTNGETLALAGTIATSTSNLKSYAVTADLTVDGSAITFQGTVAAEEDETGKLKGLTLDGTGTLAGNTQNEMFSGWSCTASKLSYQVTKLHRALSVCRADAGTGTVDETYACTMTTTVRGKPRTSTASATVQDVITWSSSTPSTGQVHVVSTTTIAGQATKSEKDVALPGSCEGA